MIRIVLIVVIDEIFIGILGFFFIGIFVGIGIPTRFRIAVYTSVAAHIWECVD